MKVCGDGSKSTGEGEGNVDVKSECDDESGCVGESVGASEGDGESKVESECEGESR